MKIRELKENDARSFYNCLKAIDHETQYMMFEPDERVWNQELIAEKLSNKNNLVLGVLEDGEIIGFLSAEEKGIDEIVILLI